uniref:Uncharacterized protein n=1 Tax=Oryza rufipogon TaxID=4529 RepID=A0A0E0RKG4_ORYRU
MDENGMDFPNRIDYRFRLEKGPERLKLGSLEHSTSAAVGAPAGGAHAPPSPADPDAPLGGLLAVGRRSPDLQRALSTVLRFAKTERRHVLGNLAATASSTSVRCPPGSGQHYPRLRVHSAPTLLRRCGTQVSGSQLQSACSPTTAASHIKVRLYCAFAATRRLPPRLRAGSEREEGHPPS